MVKLTAGKCPSCGADIQVNADLKNTICQYCGTTVLIEDAIEKYKVELSGKIEVEGIDSNKKKIENAKKHMAIGEYKLAEQIFNQVNENDSFNVESQSLWIKNTILMTELKVDYFEENFIREWNKDICKSVEMILKHFDRLKKFDTDKEYEKYLSDELPVLEYLKDEFEKLVADEKELKKWADKIWEYNFDIRMVILANQFNLDRNMMSWVKPRANGTPPNWTTSIPYTCRGLSVERDGTILIYYRSVDYKDYWETYFFKPKDGPYSKEQTIEKLSKVVDMLNDDKLVKNINKKLQKVYGNWHNVDLDKKSLLNKLGF